MRAHNWVLMRLSWGLVYLNVSFPSGTGEPWQGHETMAPAKPGTDRSLCVLNTRSRDPNETLISCPVPL
jgi:hypothetical protein